jgi:large subunit ribosomal protein L21e
MGRRKGGYRRKTRKLMRKNVRNKGKISLTAYFATFKEGDQVTLYAEPGVQNALYNLRFHGKIGTVVGMQGDCYKVHIYDGGKQKMVITHPIHLKRPGVAGAAGKKATATKAMFKAAEKSAPAPAAKPVAAKSAKPVATRAPMKPLPPATR